MSCLAYSNLISSHHTVLVYTIYALKMIHPRILFSKVRLLFISKTDDTEDNARTCDSLSLATNGMASKNEYILSRGSTANVRYSLPSLHLERS